MIRLGLRVVNLRCGGGQYHKGLRLSEAELWAMPAAGGGVVAGAARGFRRFADRGSSSLVLQALCLSSVFTE